MNQLVLPTQVAGSFRDTLRDMRSIPVTNLTIMTQSQTPQIFPEMPTVAPTYGNPTTVLIIGIGMLAIFAQAVGLRGNK